MPQPITWARVRSRTEPVHVAGAIVAAAAVLRFWALGHGIPFALGVDEPDVMERAIRMLKTGDFNPRFYDYPALYMYVQALVAAPRFIVGAMNGEWESLAQAPTSAFYFWGRAVTAALGTLTVYVVYRAGTRWGPLTAVLAATVLAVMPLHVRESHYVLTDVPMTLLVALAFLCTLRAREGPSLVAFAIAGAVAGVAGAVKYNGVLACAMPLVACAGRPASQGTIKTAAAIVAACIAAFLLCAPYTFLDLPGFLNGFGRLAAIYRSNPTGGEAIAITYLKHLRLALGWTGSAIVVAGIVLAAARSVIGPDRGRWIILLLFPLGYFVFMSSQHIVYARYLLPILPFLSLMAGAAIHEAIVQLEHLRASAVVRRASVALLLAMAIARPIWMSAKYDADAAKVWTTELAYRWIRANVPAGSSLLIESRALVFGDGYNVRNTPQLRMTAPDARTDYLVASSQCYGLYFGEPNRYPSEYADYVRIFRSSQEVARFVPSPAHPGPELRILKVMR